jgi:DNA-binding response OmpR family regulator
MRLLIVEDDPKLADFVARGLRAERFAWTSLPDGSLVSASSTPMNTTC